jgi:hypothetical protein
MRINTCIAALGVSLAVLAPAAFADPGPERLQGFLGAGPTSIPGSLPWSFNSGLTFRATNDVAVSLEYERDAAALRVDRHDSGVVSESGGGVTQRAVALVGFSSSGTRSSPYVLLGLGRYQYEYLGYLPTGLGTAYTKGATCVFGAGGSARLKPHLKLYGDARIVLDVPSRTYTADPYLSLQLHLGVLVGF